MEQDGQWGLLLQESEDVDGTLEDQVKWLEAETFWSTVKPDKPNAHDAEPDPTWWTHGVYDWWHDGDEWCTYAGDGTMTYSLMKPWMDVEDILAVDATAEKEAQDHVAYLSGGPGLCSTEGSISCYCHLKGKGKFGGKSRRGLLDQRPSQPLLAPVRERALVVRKEVSALAPRATWSASRQFTRLVLMSMQGHYFGVKSESCQADLLCRGRR